MKRQKTTQTKAITKEEDNMENFNISECLDSSIALLKKIRSRYDIINESDNAICSTFSSTVVESSTNVECVLVVGVPANNGETNRRTQILIAGRDKKLECGDRVLTKNEKFDVILVIRTWVSQQELNFLKSFFDEIEHVKIRNLNYLSSETCFGGINENAG